MSISVTALLGRERANQKQIRAAAAELIAFLRGGQDAALRVIGPSARGDQGADD